MIDDVKLGEYVRSRWVGGDGADLRVDVLSPKSLPRIDPLGDAADARTGVAP